ncbi:MAG: triose-phosphate isomerase family protein [Candidatus Komeilibacteria bacterium]
MKKYIIGNWKSELSPDQSIKLAKSLNKEFKQKIKSKREIVVCPSYLNISSVSQALKTSKIKLGAQGFFLEDYKAATGSVSIQALKDFNCQYVIIGHSEERVAYKLEEAEINRQVRIALEEKLMPILCIGEDKEARDNNQPEIYIKNQLTRELAGIRLGEKDKLVIAYEPIWAISPNGPAEPEDISRMHTLIRRLLLEILPANRLNKNVTIVYGGSINPDNIKDYINLAAVDGVLIGKASTDFDSFSSIINY